MTQSSPGSSRSFAARMDGAIESVLRWLSVVCLAVLAVLVSAIVLDRYFPIISLEWSDEIGELAFAWMVFVGTAALWRSREHITIDFIPQALAGTPAGRVLEVVLGVLALGFLAVFTWQGWILTLHARGNTSPMLELPKPLWYAPIPISGVVMMGYTVLHLLKVVRSGAQDRQGP